MNSSAMKSNRLILAFLVLPVILSSCRKEPAPAPSYIVVEPDWSACEGVVSEVGYSPWTVKIGDDYTAYAVGRVYKSDAVFASGDYAVSVMAGEPWLTASDRVISQMVVDAPTIFPEPWLEAQRDAFYYGQSDATVTDKGGRVSVPMQQYNRRLEVMFKSVGGEVCDYRLSYAFVSQVYSRLDITTGEYSEPVAQRLIVTGINFDLGPYVYDLGSYILGMPPGDKTILWDISIKDPDSGLWYSGTVEDTIDASVFEGFNDGNKAEPFLLVRTIEIHPGPDGNEITIR